MRKGIIYVYFNRAKYEKEGIEKYYVGQTVGTMEQRAGKNGRKYGTFDETCNSKFARSVRKWGWNSFEGRVLEEVYEEDLNELEKFYIEYFDSFKNGYNTTLGGEGTRGYNFNEESKKKMSISAKKHFELTEVREKQSIMKKKNWENQEYREKLSEKISIANKKRFEDLKEREKQSKIMKKHCEDPKYREKISKGVKKHYEDPKEREKMSKAQRKRWENQKEREKISKAIKKNFENPEVRKKCGHPGEKNGKARSIYCKELNIVFSYVKLTEKYCVNILNIKIGPIRDVCNGKRKSTGKLANGTKLTWSWTENLDKETLNNAEYIDSKKYEEIINAKINN